jgi:hypothetical protein
VSFKGLFGVNRRGRNALLSISLTISLSYQLARVYPEGDSGLDEGGIVL